MRDIRRPYRNLNSNPRNREVREKDIDKNVENFEMDEYDDVEFDSRGKPIIKASKHYGLDGVSKKAKEEYDVLDRKAYFSDSPRRREIKSSPKTKKFNFSFILILLIISTIIGIFVWTSFFGRAIITINPKYKDVDLSDTYDFNINDILIATSSESSSKTIPKSAPKELNSKAKGGIVIYNNYSNSPQKLIKNTRFQTKDGKVFRISDSVTVPGKSQNGPGSIKAKVIADTYGANYNIPPSDFQIPGFKGNARYDLIYAKSLTYMTQGSSGVVTIVDPKDISIARTELSNINSEKLSTNIKSLEYDGYIGLKDDPIIKEEDNANELLDPDNNKYILTDNASVIFLSKEELSKQIAKSVLKDSFNENDKFRLENLKNLSFSIDKNINLQNSTITVLVTGETRLVFDYDKDRIIKDIAGKKVSEFNNILRDILSNISGQSFKLTPSWQRYFPSSVERIQVKEEFK